MRPPYRSLVGFKTPAGAAVPSVAIRLWGELFHYDASYCEPCASVFMWISGRLVDEGELSPTEISPASAFAEDIRLDSLSMIELIMDLEKQFGATISNNAVADVRTVADVVRCVRKQSSRVV